MHPVVFLLLCCIAATSLAAWVEIRPYAPLPEASQVVVSPETPASPPLPSVTTSSPVPVALPDPPHPRATKPPGTISLQKSQVPLSKALVPGKKEVARTAAIPREELIALTRKGDVAAITTLYRHHGARLNDSLRGRFRLTVFQMLVTENWTAAKELFATGRIDPLKNPGAINAAVNSGNLDALRFMMANGFSPEATIGVGLPPILNAVSRNELEMVNLLETEGADLHQIYHGKNALDWAVTSRFTDPAMFDYLLAQDMQFRTQNLLDATRLGNVEALDLIFDHQPELLFAVQDDGRNIMDIAVAQAATPASIAFLLDHGFVLTDQHLAKATEVMEDSWKDPLTGAALLLPIPPHAPETHALIAHVLATGKIPGPPQKKPFFATDGDGPFFLPEPIDHTKEEQAPLSYRTPPSLKK